MTACFERLVKPGDVVLDVGANVGYYTLMSSLLVGPTGHVFAVEASPSTRRRLEANLALNRVTNVTVLPYAAWDDRGRATLMTPEGGNGRASLCKVSKSVRDEEVDLVRLDDVIPAEFHARLSLIKIDIEGAACRALMGMTSILEAAPSLRVLCEVSEEMEGDLGGSARQVFELLGERGFRPHGLVNNYTPHGYIEPRISPPEPLDEPPQGSMDVLFERPA